MKKDRILITGGTGFLGKQVSQHLTNCGFENVYPIGSKDFDLSYMAECEEALGLIDPHVIIHCAAACGGIGLNQQMPATLFEANMRIGMNLVEASQDANLKNFIFVSTVCAYPCHTPVPFREEDAWSGKPEPTNLAYAMAKKAVEVYLDACRQERGFNSAVLYLANMYGPNDNFDPNSSHVIPAIINKIQKAKEDHESNIVLFGDGSPTRDFLYVRDAAEAIEKALYYKDGLPINIGTGIETSIKDLANIIAEEMDYWGDISWNAQRPNGQPRRCLDITRAKEILRWTPKTDLLKGIRETLKWYSYANF